MSQATLLIVEDEAIVAADLAAKLTQLGYEVVGITAQGPEAIALASRYRPQVVLMDIWLKGPMDGIEAAEAIRRQFDLPVIYLTAHADAATLARAKFTEPFGYILKPFEERDLATHIEMALYKHQADRQLREQREWLRVTLNSIGDGVIACDANGKINFLNPVAQSLTGWKAEEALGQTIQEVFRCINEQTHLALEDPVARVLREGRVVALANHAALVARNGREVPIEDSAAPILDSGGQLIGVVLVFHDVTEKRRAEEALRKNREDLHRAQAVAHTGSWGYDFRSKEISWSDETYQIFGIPKGTLLTYERFLSAVHPDDRPDVEKKWTAALSGETYDVTLRLIVNGQIKWVRGLGEVEFDSKGRLLSTFGTVQDIAQLKQTEEALKEADRRKDEFLATLAHELRNPLAPICNALGILEKTKENVATFCQVRDMMDRQMKHMVRLVDDLLDVSRISRGKIELQKERLDLATVVHSALETSRLRIEEGHHELAVVLPEEPVVVEGDLIRLAQALSNLLHNAAKYTPQGGRITLSVELEDMQGVIRVRDNGVGIPQKMLPDIFEMFVQGERSLDRSQGGLGIGLTLVRSLVEMHGGTVEAHSEGLGHGAEFVVRLPLLPDLRLRRPDAALGGDGEGVAAKSPGRRILVVDDNKDSADSLAMLLQVLGHEVRTAYSGPNAVKVALAFVPELVLLDIGMPGMDGYEVARRLRGEAILQKTLLVAQTGWGQEEDRFRALQAGFDHHLVKPVELTALQTLLAQMERGQESFFG